MIFMILISSKPHNYVDNLLKIGIIERLFCDAACVQICSTCVLPDVPEEHMNSFSQEICIRDISMGVFPPKMLLPFTLSLAVVRANISVHLVGFLVRIFLC